MGRDGGQEARAAGSGASLPAGAFAPTIESKVSYVQLAKFGVSIGSGRVVARKTSIAFLAGELRNEAGELIATATATARIVMNATGG